MHSNSSDPDMCGYYVKWIVRDGGDAGENTPVRNALWQVVVQQQFLKHTLCITMLEALGPLGRDGGSRTEPVMSAQGGKYK